MRRFLSILLALGLVLSLNLLTAVPVLAAPEVWVDDNAPNDPGPYDNTVSDPLEDGSQDHPYDKIQEGIDAADSPGGIVHVDAGTYDEHDVDLKNGVSVLGAGAAVTIIDGGSTGSNSTVTCGGTVMAGTVLDGFTITHGSRNYGGGMYINGGSPTVSNCIFYGNEAGTRGGGMYIFNAPSPVVANCVFYGNTSYGTGGAIGCRSNSSPTIINCTITGNTAATNGGGIYVDSTSTPTITNNIIYNNSASSGSGIYSAAALVIDYNDVFSNTLVNCTSNHDPAANPQLTGTYHLQLGSPCIDVGSNAAVTAAGLTTDFEGDPRVFDGDIVPGAVVDMGADEYYVAPPPPPPPPPSSGTVGGTVHPIDKASLLLPWLGLGVLLVLAAGGLILIRRQAR